MARRESGTALLGLVSQPSPSNRDLVAVLEPVAADPDAVDLGAVGGAQVDYDVPAAAVFGPADLGVPAADVGVGQNDLTFGHPADGRRMVTQRDAAAVGQHQSRWPGTGAHLAG